MSYAALSIGIFLFIFSYFFLNTPSKTPKKPPPQGLNFCVDVDGTTPQTFQAPADNVTKVGSKDDEDEEETPALSNSKVDSGGGCKKKGDRHKFGALTTYQLIKKSVPLSKTSVPDRRGDTTENFDDDSCHTDSTEKLGFEIPEIDKSKFRAFYPEISGEIDMKRKIPSRTRGRDSNLLYFIDYGLIFLLHLDDKGEYIQYKGIDTENRQNIFYIADIYQDVGSGRPLLPDDAFTCGKDKSGKAISGGQILDPKQEKSSDSSQLQQQYFLLTIPDVVNGWGIHCKPAVYLYPPSKQLVNVKVYPSGFLTYVDPPYDKDNGWNVTAFPDGSLRSMNNEPITSNYLYFESKIHDHVIKKPEQGWVVKFSELEKLYQDILPKLGLNPKQTLDFIEYWNKALPESPYYFVGIIDQENVNEIERLEITPKPDSINRVRIYFERLDAPKTVQTPDLSLIKNFKFEILNSHFSVVEWGGMVKNDPNHPFTCSQ